MMLVSRRVKPGYEAEFERLMEPVAESRPEIEESGRGSSCPG
jgi:hypothetical protein